jgi:hypothetical protein
MMKDTVINLGLSSTGDIKRAVRRLEVEYAISSGLAHGSHAIISDSLNDDRTLTTHPYRSAHLIAVHLIVRIITDLILALVAIELCYDVDLGTDDDLRKALRLYSRDPDRPITVYTDNHVLTLLAYALLPEATRGP